MPRSRISILLSAAVVFILYRLLFTGSRLELVELTLGPPADQFPSWNPQETVREEVEVLKALGLSSKFEYRRFCISSTPKANVERSSVHNTRMAFFRRAEGAMMAASQLGMTAENSPGECSATLNLDVPYFDKKAPVDTSALMLGMATTLPRLNSSLPAIARWLAHTGTVLQILVTDHADLEKIKDDIDSLKFTAWTMGIELLFDAHEFWWESDGRKSFALARVLDWHKRPETKWFGIIDDDTFFVSLPQLVDALRAFNAERHWYIGSLSEGLSRIAREGWKAAAGAGFFISVPLMSHLASNYDDCRELDQGYGDLLWRDCIITYTSPTTSLTELPGLNQLDLWKDVSGWYEAYQNPLYTLHHWKSWHYHPVPVAHMITDLAGPSTFLQRYGFLDDTILHNGYSIVNYPHGEPNLNLIEGTMVEDVGKNEYPEQKEFLHRLGRTREPMKLGRKKLQWKFETSITGSDGSVNQFYVKRASSGQSQNIDNVIQVDWTAAQTIQPLQSTEDRGKTRKKPVKDD